MSTIDKDNKWIVTSIDYSTRWLVARALSETIAKALTKFVINDLYRDYDASKKIIIDRDVNLWAQTMNRAFELLETKHKKTTFYHSRTNEIVKRFNDTLRRMLTKYCIDQLIKNWDIYLNQTLFATRIRTHTTIDFSLFYLLYDINSSLLDDAFESTLVYYDERVDFASFLSKERAEIFKKTM